LDVGPSIAELGPLSDSFIDLAVSFAAGACYIPAPLACWRRLAGSYASHVSADFHASWRLTELAEHLMRTRYRHLFPAQCVDAWVQHQRYALCLAKYRALAASHGGSTLSQALCDTAVRAYLFARFRKGSPAVLLDGLHRLLLRKLSRYWGSGLPGFSRSATSST